MIGSEPKTTWSQKPIQPNRENALPRLVPLEGLIAFRNRCSMIWSLLPSGRSYENRQIEDRTSTPSRSCERCQTNMRSLVKPDKERILPCAELFGTHLPTRCSPRRHFDDELHEIVLGFSRRHERREILQIAPAQSAVGAVWKHGHFIFRVAHLNLHEALEEGRLVVIEGRRQDIP